MSTRHILTLSIATITIAATTFDASALPFVPGNIVVERIGNGSTALGNAAVEVAVVEYAPTGGPAVQTINLASTGSDRLTDSGTGTSSGYLNLSSDQTRITVPGYDAAVGTASVTGTSGNRTIGAVVASGSLAGSVDVTTATAWGGNNFRSVISDGNSNYWGSGAATGAGNTGGVHYVSSAGVATQLSTSVTNTRNIEIYGGQLWVSSASGAFLGINKVGTGLPTTAGQTITNTINLGSGAQAYGFFMFDSDSNGELDRAWIADDRTGLGGGIQRWNLVGGIWTQDYQLRLDVTANTLTNTGSTLRGLRGLTGSVSDGTVSLFATDSDGQRLVSITDTLSIGADPTSFTLLATAGTNFVFRGVDFAPVPEPSVFVSLIGGIGTLMMARRKRR